MKTLLYNGKTISIDKKFKAEIDIVLDTVLYDEMDLVIVITGEEGWGKSKTARELAIYCSNYLGSEMGIDNIHFALEQYLQASLKGDKFKINVLDEARNVLGQAKVRNKQVERFLDYLSECRAMRQVHIICIPAYHDLKKYVVNWRCVGVMRMLKKYDRVDSTVRKSGFKMNRGEYKFYTDKSQLEYFYDKKYKYPKKWTAWARWTAVQIFDENFIKEYDIKKKQFTLEKYGEQNDKISRNVRTAIRREYLSKMKKEVPSWTNVKLGEMFGVNESVIRNDFKVLEAEN